MTAPRAFVCGWPVAHSRSPLIHRYWLARHGIAGDYAPVAEPPETAAAFLAGFAERGYVGGNVTIPHKETALAVCAEATATARRLGAVNTLWVDDGKVCGDNTDAYGFAANLDERAPGWRNAGRALVIGAGGAARAVVDALAEAGLSVAVVNRNLERARDLTARFPRAAAHRLDDVRVLLAAADLIVNTTPAGMAGAPALEIDWRPARSEAIAAGIVYVPLRTPFLAGAAERGLRTVDGLGMLLHQAAPGFERWFGARPTPTAELRALAEADLDR